MTTTTTKTIDEQMIKNGLTRFCEERFIYLLLEHDKEGYILRKLRNNDFVDEIEKKLWVQYDLSYYLWLETYNIELEWVDENMKIKTCSFCEWNPTKYNALKTEITQMKYIDALYTIAENFFETSIWKEEQTQKNIDNLFDSILSEHCRILIYDKSSEELLDYVNELCPEFCPK